MEGREQKQRCQREWTKKKTEREREEKRGNGYLLHRSRTRWRRDISHMVAAARPVSISSWKRTDTEKENGSERRRDREVYHNWRFLLFEICKALRWALTRINISSRSDTTSRIRYLRRCLQFRSASPTRFSASAVVRVAVGAVNSFLISGIVLRKVERVRKPLGAVARCATLGTRFG